jgi:uncharacterized protein YecE (DUF72 family)
MNKEHILKIGTSGYSYDDWRGTFYPQDLPKGKMLEYYSKFFNCVEINATYYTIPSDWTFQRMADKTQRDFEFVVKTNQETTHRRQENEVALKKLIEAVKPLIDAEKFKGFLAQFPYSFKNNEQNRKYLVDTKKIVGDYPLFIEFRNYTWLNPQVPAFLKDLKISYVNVDEPQLRGLLPVQEIVTTSTAYIRMHGRNEKDWWDGQGSQRYDYLYSADELQEWLTNISNILKKTYKTYIFFNNHPTGKAIKNAQQMVEILKSIDI